VLEHYLDSSVLGRARKKGAVRFSQFNIRDFSRDKHKTVDDSPYGGGAGMVIRADVLHAAWEAAQKKSRAAPSRAYTVLLSPQGRILTQAKAKELSKRKNLILVCGHYEGVDERFVEECVDEEISIGDYVITGGELPALVVADAVVRLLPKVLGNEESARMDSLENGLLKYPQYTRPAEFRGRVIPEILRSGNHGAIARWRLEQSLKRTHKKRPDLKS